MFALLCDIGSTYTKLRAVDLATARLVGSSVVSTTPEDLSRGVGRALTELQRQLPRDAEFVVRRAASSAAGGMNLVAVGLVPELTGEAARMAALGAGAKVLRVYGHGLQSADLEEIKRLNPDIVLLTGGTDGGDSTVLLHNARSLADAKLPAAVVVAGNRNAVPEALELLRQAGCRAVSAGNVLPRLGQLAVEDARQAIRSLFLERIVCGRGLEQVETEFGGQVAMPTPVAVLQGLQLLAKAEGELMAIDLGGATTDVYSLTAGLPVDDAVIPAGLRPPFSHRTVEADLGLRISAPHLVEQQMPTLVQTAPSVDWALWANDLAESPNWVAETPDEQLQELALAKACVREAVNRHAGRVQPMVTPYGRNFLLYGKDLRQVKKIIGIGGIFRNSPYAGAIVTAALQDGQHPELLKPLPGAELLLDADYVLPAAGLLAESHPECALQLIKNSLKPALQ
jgi:uncharacterized protein (TIGR01319 family)